MDDTKFRELTPSPDCLIESLRDIGYTIETAVADIVDNSIAAEAYTIDIRFAWNEGCPWLAIIDNGWGMSEDELIESMRFGSKSPLATRSKSDLGRFGLGMKTASLSQCRHMVVISRKDGQTTGCSWDLDRIQNQQDKSWRVELLSPEDIQDQETLKSIFEEYLKDRDSGSIVVWLNMDRFSGSEPFQENVFNTALIDVRHHLEEIYHRFLASPVPRRNVRIAMNGDELTAFDPFNTKNLATIELQKQRFSIEGSRVVVQPYVLPHHTKVSKEEYVRYAGTGGYLHNQGFYIYRNSRLIIKGTWFRIIKKEELNKLIRVKVDIPNTLDHLWKIDVKKSGAYPPESVRKELKQVIDKIEISGRRVYSQRGIKLRSETRMPIWNRKASHGEITYEINRDHTFLVNLKKTLSAENIELLDNLLATIEGGFPVESFFSDVAGRSEQVKKPQIPREKLAMLLGEFISIWQSKDNDSLELEEMILQSEPFASHRELTEQLLKEKPIS